MFKILVVLRCDLCRGTMRRNNVISSGECQRSEVSDPSPGVLVLPE